MYEEIGKKIKWLAKVLFAVGAVLSVIIAVNMASSVDENQVALVFIVVFIGFVISWISTWLLYGYGEIIDKLCDIEENTRNPIVRVEQEPQSKKSDAQAKSWTCACGRVNPNYVSSCFCGANKTDIKREQ